jgi:putative membrane protein
MNMGYGYGPGWGMLNGWGGYGYGYGYGLIHMVIWIVILVAIVALVVWLVRSLAGPGMHMHQMGPPRRSAGLDVLEERYARGEINRDEYLQKKKDIGG